MGEDQHVRMITPDRVRAARIRIPPRGPSVERRVPGACLVVLTVLAAACGAGAGIEVGDSDFAAPVGSQAPNLAVAGGGEVLLTYTEPTEGGHAVRLAVRARGTWETRSTIVENDSLFVNWADFPSARATADGKLVAHWLQKIAPDRYAYHVFMRVSDDGGRTWGVPFRPHGDRSPTEHGFVSMVPWQDGLAAIWLDGRNTTGHAEAPGSSVERPAMSLRFTTVSSTGPAPDVELDQQVCDCCQTALAATSRALVAAYRDRADGEIRDVVTARYVDGAWTPPTGVHDDGWYYPGCPVNGPALAARNDTVAVAWFTAAHDTPRAAIAFSTDGGETFGNRTVLDDGRPAGRVDVLWIADRVIVVWLEDTRAGGEVRARLVGPDGTASRAVTVGATTAARAAGFPRMAAVGDTVYVAWTNVVDEPRVHVTRLTVR